MYVVMMAMLALNVSSDVLNGFSLVEESLNRTTENATSTNQSIYTNFEAQMKANPTKVKAWYDKALYVRGISDSLFNLAEELKALKEPIFLVGDGSNLTFNTLKDTIPALVLPPEHRMHQRASGVALAAAKKIAAGDPGDGAARTPNYLRLSQAERERAEKMQQEQ